MCYYCNIDCYLSAAVLPLILVGCAKYNVPLLSEAVPELQKTKQESGMCGVHIRPQLLYDVATLS